jgi:dienelactone hydrolase
MGAERRIAGVATIQTARMSRTRQRTRLAARVLLALLALLCLALALSPLGRATTRAAFLLPALITGEEPGAFYTLGEPISHTSQVISSQDGPVYLDIYAPTSPAPLIPGDREGIVVIPGVGDNREVPQLVNLMQSLARSGVVAVALTTNTLIDYDLAPTTIDAVVAATQYTQRLPDVEANHVGLVGFSAGGSLACLAAADPRIRDSLAFVTSFGGYFNAKTLLTDIGRRALTADGNVTPWPVDGVPVQTLANVIGDALPSGDAALLRAGFNESGIALSPDEVRQLSPSGQAAYHLLAGDEPEQVAANLAALPPSLQTLLTSLSPSAVVANLHAPVYLLHDRSDHFVPYTESRAFDAALTHAGHSHSYAEFSIFQHVEVKSGLGVGQLVRDGWSLFQILIRVMEPGA